MAIETGVTPPTMGSCQHCGRVSQRRIRTDAGVFCSKDCSLLDLETPPHRSPRFWIGQIVMPAAILLGVFLPMDIGSALLLGPIFLCGLVWASSLLGGLFRTLRRRPVYRLRYLRGALSVVFFVLVATASSLSMNAAVSFAESAALDLQAQCAEDGTCPEAPEGWEAQVNGVAETTAGMTIQHRLIYMLVEDRRSFRIDLRQTIDRGLTWYGGAELEVRSPGDPLPTTGWSGPALE